MGDGLKPRVSQALILVGDEVRARRIARRLIKRGANRFEAAAPGAALMLVDSSAVAEMGTGDASQFCGKARDEGHWIYLENVEQLTTSSGGSCLLEPSVMPWPKQSCRA